MVSALFHENLLNEMYDLQTKGREINFQRLKVMKFISSIQSYASTDATEINKRIHAVYLALDVKLEAMAEETLDKAGDKWAMYMVTGGDLKKFVERMDFGSIAPLMYELFSQKIQSLLTNINRFKPDTHQ